MQKVSIKFYHSTGNRLYYDNKSVNRINSSFFYAQIEKGDGDHASDMSNPTSKDYKLAQDKRADYLNPNNPEFKGDTVDVNKSTAVDVNKSTAVDSGKLRTTKRL